ncbi:MAG: NAD(+) diphosphatase [Actinobacteria bacterium]|nr:NAD(+) diphosphatase [Actinomycetota bacterium]
MVNESGNRGRLSSLVLARSTVDRSSLIRADNAKLDELWNSAHILVMINELFVSSETHLRFFSAADLCGEGERYFLGIHQESGQSYFVWNSRDTSLQDALKVTEDDLKGLRQIGAVLSDLHAGLAAHALALLHWHATHPRCSRCGEQTIIELGGAMRVCPADQSQHHPRTDPAIIVLVKDEDDRLLLGRQSIWPEKRFSNFAGFVEPGESFEQCVVREVAEECGVLVHSVHYLGSQPWPFPASIMIAFESVTSDPSTALADGEEITEIRWYSREEMKKAVEDGELSLPPRISVSRRMIEHWYGPNAQTELSRDGE